MARLRTLVPTVLAGVAAGGLLGCPAFHYGNRDIDRTPVTNTGAGASIIYPGQTAPPHPGAHHPREAGYGTPTSGAAPLTVAFSDASAGAVTAWSWNFGDTNTATLQNPLHTYSAVGTYTVTFSDCMNGTIRYEFSALDLAGAIPITRVAPDNAALCEALQNK